MAIPQQIENNGSASSLCASAGHISYSEFLAMRLHAELLAEGEVSHRLTQRAFAVLDRDGDGLVRPLREVRWLLLCFGVSKDVS